MITLAEFKKKFIVTTTQPGQALSHQQLQEIQFLENIFNTMHELMQKIKLHKEKALLSSPDNLVTSLFKSAAVNIATLISGNNSNHYKNSIVRGSARFFAEYVYDAPKEQVDEKKLDEESSLVKELLETITNIKSSDRPLKALEALSNVLSKVTRAYQPIEVADERCMLTAVDTIAPLFFSRLNYTWGWHIGISDFAIRLSGQATQASIFDRQLNFIRNFLRSLKAEIALSAAENSGLAEQQPPMRAGLHRRSGGNAS